MGTLAAFAAASSIASIRRTIATVVIPARRVEAIETISAHGPAYTYTSSYNRSCLPRRCKRGDVVAKGCRLSLSVVSSDELGTEDANATGIAAAAAEHGYRHLLLSAGGSPRYRMCTIRLSPIENRPLLLLSKQSIYLLWRYNIRAYELVM